MRKLSWKFYCWLILPTVIMTGFSFFLPKSMPSWSLALWYVGVFLVGYFGGGQALKQLDNNDQTG